MRTLTCFISSVIAVLLLSGCAGELSLPVNCDIQCNIPEDPSKPEAGRFIPVDTPFLITITLTDTNGIPEHSKLAIRVVDHENKLLSIDEWTLPVLQDETAVFNRLLRLSGLSGSKKVKIQAALKTATGDTIKCANSTEGIWISVLEGYALHQSMAFSSGWYKSEATSKKASDIRRWCKGKGIIHFPRPLYPALLEFNGYSQLDCFPENRWNLGVTLNSEPVIETEMMTRDFQYSIRITEAAAAINTRPAEGSWPVGEMELIMESDRVFKPIDCNGTLDKRFMAFHIQNLALSELIWLTGSQGDRRDDGCFWPKPEFQVKIPRPSSGSGLYIQGKRNLECIEMPQTFKVMINDQILPSQSTIDEDFCLFWPVKLSHWGEDESVTIKVTVIPSFFGSDCGNSEDSNVYGAGISEICVR